MPNINQQNRTLEPWELELQDDPLYRTCSPYSRSQFNPNPIRKYHTTIRFEDEGENWEELKNRVDAAIEAENPVTPIIETVVTFSGNEYPELEIGLYRMETPEEVTVRIANHRANLMRQQDYRRQQYETLRAEFEGQDSAE